MAGMPTIFTRIIDGEIPGTFVWRDDVCVVFLSINPMAHGHALVVPRAEVEHWIDLPAETVSHLMKVAHVVGRAQQAAFDCERVGLIIAGYEVPHVHVHVIPTTDMRQLSFANAAASVPSEELARAAAALRSALTAAGHTEVV
jgi:histidine triad (HIT) family protein